MSNRERSKNAREWSLNKELSKIISSQSTPKLVLYSLRKRENDTVQWILSNKEDRKPKRYELLATDIIDRKYFMRKVLWNFL